MTTLEIIKLKLNFLITKYNMKFLYIEERGETYSFENEYGVFKYYEWTQFKEEKFSVLFNNQYEEINMFLRYPKLFTEFNEKHKGIKWRFKDHKADYWDMIARIIELEINNNNSLFGLRLST